MDDILEFRPATEQERLYTYAQTHELYMHSACLGHLRGDFDSGGYGFYTTWEDHHGAEKTPEFKAEFDRVVNALRDPSAYKGVLFNRDAMRAYLHHGVRLPGEHREIRLRHAAEPHQGGLQLLHLLL